MCSSSVKQDAQPVDAYIEQFEVQLAQVGDLPEEQCLGYFLCGLREEISRRIGIHEPRTIMRTMDLARAIEEELSGHQESYHPWYPAMGYRGTHGLEMRDGPRPRAWTG